MLFRILYLSIHNMKKLLFFLFIAAIVSNKIKAQSFTMQADTIYYTLSGIDVNTIEDAVQPNASSVTLQWHVIACNFPASWVSASGICDNILCYTMNGLWPSGAIKTTFPYTATGDFHLQIANNAVTDNGCYYATIHLQDQATADTAIVTFAVCRNPTAVPRVTSTLHDANIYPNPASGTTTLSFSLASSSYVAISIYDAIGHEIYDHKAKMQNGTNYINLPIANLTKGIYFVTINANGNKLTQKFSVIK